MRGITEIDKLKGKREEQVRGGEERNTLGGKEQVKGGRNKLSC